jgi:hypothetical protein
LQDIQAFHLDIIGIFELVTSGFHLREPADVGAFDKLSVVLLRK